jgi:hypothetical protein
MKNNNVKHNCLKSLLFVFMSAGILLMTAFLFESKPVIHPIGDSIYANNLLNNIPDRGWEQLIPNYFNEDVIIENHTVNGRNINDKGIFVIQNGDYPAEEKEDNAHFTRYSAIEVAKQVIAGIKELNPSFAKEIISSPAFSQKANGKVVALDYFFNHELKKDSKGNVSQFHYTWEDTENTGYSKLGNLIENLGAQLSELHESPTFAELKNVSIYIIVDPDTPRETEKPNYISEEAIKEITKFVKNGGVLVLFGNDKGNCEFENFNKLAGKFGIHFNEVSRNRVEGTKYEMGKFDRFPDHPIFKGLKSIFLKEISTFKLLPPALPLFEEGGDIIMAISRLGNGFVFALGDPWIYNEYIDHRILPVEYQNYEAAENLFIWLLKISKKVR